MKYDKTLEAHASRRTRASAWGVEKPSLLPAKDKVGPAKAARLNVTSRGLDDECIAQAAIAIINGNGSREIEHLARQVRTAGRNRAEVVDSVYSYRTDLATLPAAHLQYAYVLPPLSYAGPVSPEGCAARLLSRHADERIVSVLERELSVSHEEHGEALRDLRRYSPEIYDLLIGGSPCSALETARSSGEVTVCLVRPIVATHAMLLSVATAHLRIAELRANSANPMMNGWAGQAEWPTMRQVSLSALVGPAQVIPALLGLPVEENATDDQALRLAESCGFLEDDDSSHRVIAIANLARDHLPEHALTRGYVQHATRSIVGRTECVGSLKIRDLNDAGWARRSFTEQRFGVTASEGAVIVAINLAVQRGGIDACIDAVLEGRSLPSFDADPGTEKLSDNSLARLTEALRIEGRADKLAPAEPGNPENHNGKSLVKKTRRKIEKGEVGCALVRLRIDPAAFFRHRIAPASIGYGVVS